MKTEDIKINERQYLNAIEIIKNYHNQVNNFINQSARNDRDLANKYTHVKLLGIYDTHHNYEYLEVNKVYKIKKWYHGSTFNGGRKSESFSIIADKTRKYYTTSNMLGWEFLKIKGDKQ